MSDRLSLLVSHVLDRMGYSEEMRQYRIDKYGEENFVKSLCSNRQYYQPVLAGSKAEGASTFYESDFDFLDIYGGVKATECEDIIEGDNDLTLYMESDTAPPGYCKLQLLQYGRNNVHHQLFLRDECYVRCPGYCRSHLSSTFVLHSEQQYMPYHTEISGPSNKGQGQGEREMDSVLAIRCSDIPNSLKIWIKRCIQKNRPKRQILEQVARSDVYLVPAGKHGSDHQFLEWRLSFNMAEKILIHNFTSVQYKVYILLKMFMKEMIQPQCPESITSYIVKTLMLWAVEQLFSEVWRNENLVQLFSVLVKGLYSSVQNGHCSMYFIPSDNILQGRITEETQKYICTKVAAILSGHDLCVLTIPSIERQIYQLFHVPLPLHNDLEKAEILINHVRATHCRSLNIIDRDLLLCCLQESAAIPYNELLTDLVSVELPARSDWKEHVKYFLGQVLSSLALQECAGTNSQRENNKQKYTTMRRCTKLVNVKRGTQTLCGKLDLAHIFYMLGQYEAALKVLTDAAETMRYYMKKISQRNLVQRRKAHCRLIKPLAYECISTKKMFKHFAIQDQRYDMEACLPKALRYEIHRSCDERKKEVNIDPEVLLYYLQYLCNEQLGKKRYAHAAFTNMVRCSKSDFNIEYREVSLNVLGHCLLKKGLYGNAAKVLIKSFMFSLYLQEQEPRRPYLDKSAAIWHIAILLNKIGIP